MENKKWNKGDVAWAITYWNGVVKIEINSEEIKEKGIEEPYYNIIETESRISICQPKRKIFKTRKDALQAYNADKEAKRDNFRKKIHTEEDLLNFMFYFTNAEEYTNYEARDVIREKCKELFGIDISEDFPF